MGEADPDDFDEIVQHLDLDLSFPEEESRPDESRTDRPPSDDVEQLSFDDLPDEPFYRQVPTPPARKHHPRRTAATLAVLGAPISIMVVTFLHIFLPRPVLLAIGLIFVAGAVYLIAQLPEHGPSRPDWPDDGAAL